MGTRSWMLAVCCVLIFGMTVPSQAGLIYGDSAGSNSIHTIDLATGNETLRFNPGSGNGRGIVVVGDVIYYTVVGDPHIYKMDRATGTLTGSILTSNQSMSTIAWDGSHFWTSDYSGSNKAWEIDITGTTMKTITLGNAGSYMDGMEYYNGKLIANRGDAPNPGIYDVYDLNGNLLQPAFITNPYNSTGIAFDGTDFYVSNIFNSSINVFNGTTGVFSRTIGLTTLIPGSYFLIEDLSVDYAQRSDTGGKVPEPGTMMLLGSGLVGLAAWRRKK